MCRWLAYSGNEIYLSRLLFEPEHSLIDQSLRAEYSASTTNGDGFGVGWYGERPEPGLFKDVRPAWNDPNLKDLARHIRSHLFLAHVRSAHASEIQRTNCHPFRHGRWLCMHNGRIAQLARLKRDLAMAVDPELFPEILGTTDTEIMFHLALTFGLDESPVEAVERMVGLVTDTAERYGVEDAVQMTLCLSDGERLFGFRHATRGEPRSLFVSREGDCWEELSLDSSGFSRHARIIVSEPFGGVSEAWDEVPEGSVVVVEGGKIERRAFTPRWN